MCFQRRTECVTNHPTPSSRQGQHFVLLKALYGGILPSKESCSTTLCSWHRAIAKLCSNCQRLCTKLLTVANVADCSSTQINLTRTSQTPKSTASEGSARTCFLVFELRKSLRLRLRLVVVVVARLYSSICAKADSEASNKLQVDGNWQCNAFVGIMA